MRDGRVACRGVSAFKGLRTQAQEVVEGCFNNASMRDENDGLALMGADQFVQLGVHTMGELADGLEPGPEAMVVTLTAFEGLQCGHEGFHAKTLVAALPFAQFCQRLWLQTQCRRNQFSGLACPWQCAGEEGVCLHLLSSFETRSERLHLPDSGLRQTEVA